MSNSADHITISAAQVPRTDDVLTPDACRFISALHRQFEPARTALLERRSTRQRELNTRVGRGETLLGFLPETRQIRESNWQVATAPRALQKRWVELTGPTERKMMINALNSGADVFMADFEDANSPTWANMIGGQANLIDAVAGTIAFTAPDGKQYRLQPTTATLMVRPRGWHLPEVHVQIEGMPIAGALFDFGLFFFHNARRLAERGLGPYFYLPKLESHLEARLWNDIFVYAEDALQIPRGTVRATVLIETIWAAFEMDEILYELREHAGGLNAGRWDYLFSLIKTFAGRPEFLLPDRSQVTMTVPFMRAYTELLVKTCHRRGAYAIGGMAAFVPSRRDPEATAIALEQVRADKLREVRDGFDGTWIAHPDLVDTARAPFAEALGDHLNQLHRLRDEVDVSASDLLDMRVPDGTITEAGLRRNVSVGLQYLAAWLQGAGSVALYHLMEDAATAEISRAQVWQWVRHAAPLDGRRVTPELVQTLLEEECMRISETIGESAYTAGRYREAAELFRDVALGPEFIQFLTLPGYARLEPPLAAPARRQAA